MPGEGTRSVIDFERLSSRGTSMGKDHPAASRKDESRTSREVRLSFKLVSSFVLCV